MLVMMEVLWVLVACACTVGAFNVDVDSCVKHRGPHRGSMFGFAVQEHVENGVKMVLVGAPQDDTHRRPGVVRPGAVYQCSTNVESSCREVIFDHYGNNNDTYNRQIDQKSYEWFGATLVSSGVDGPVVACAPRYVTYVSAKLNQREPVGTCFVAKNSFTDINEYAPCRTSNYGYHKTGVCQAGFAAGVSKDGSRLFMGAPGSYYWQGQTYSQSLASRPMMVATAESSSLHDDSYMGYSLTVGDFGGHGGEQGVAVGMPRGAELRGKVVMYTWNLENIKNVSGSQIGAYFGYSVAAGDIDGDGLTDLIVGAPMYTVPNNEGSFEQGRVYVIYQGRAERPFKLNHYRTGQVSRGRFGLSVASLGDINLDGFGDFAVGAPYSGEHGNGVVFLYYGSKDGVREKYSQAITAEQVAPGMTTFGFSLSGGVDMDDNLYNDLVVGAYKSDMAVFFRSRPVVKVTASVVLDSADSKEISLDDAKCTLHSGLKVACMDVEYCLQYDGFNVDTSIEFELFLNLDSLQKKSRRMYFLNDETNYTFKRTIVLNRQQHWCGNAKVYIAHEVRDKLTPLQVTMEYNLKKEDYGRRDYIPPVLDLTVGNSRSDAVNISKNCGADKICIPNLKMHVEPSVSKYLLGSQEKLGISVFVENSGEDAFEASYYLQIPPGIHFVKAERLETGKTEGTAVHCATPTISDEGNSTLRCDIGNPLQSNQMVNFKVILQPYDIESATQKYVFSMETNSTNPERDSSRFDNTYTLTVGVWVDTNVSIIGVSLPPELHYNASLYQTDAEKVVTRDTELGPHVVHAYSVKNNGPALIEEAEMFVIWPYQTLAGEHLFYLLTQPETSGNVKCDMADHVNEEAFLIERKGQQFFLPQIIQGLEANKVAGQVGNGESQSSQSFTSEEERRRIVAEQERISGHRQYSQSASGFEQRQNSFNTNNARQGSGSATYGQHAGNTNQNEGNQNGRGSQYGSTNQYGSSSGQYGANSNQYGSTSSQRGSISSQSGSSWQQGRSNDQYGSSSGSTQRQYGSSSNEYGKVGGGNVNQDGSRGSGHRYNVYRERNITYDIDAQGHVKKTETSTEYGNLGHEGEVGSSWNNRRGSSYQGSSSTNQGSSSINQGSSSTYQGSSSINQGSVNRSGNQNWQQGGSSSSGNRNGYGNSYQNLGWSTEESVNKNLFNAGSRTFVQGTQESEGIEEVVGGEEESLGGFASVAYNPNNEFRTVWSEVDGAGASQSRSAGSSQSGSAGVSHSGSQSGTAYSEHSYGSNGAYAGGVGGASYGSDSQRGGSSQSSYSSSGGYSGGSQSGSSYHESRQYSSGSSSSGGSYSSEASGSRPANYQQWNHRSRRQTQYIDIDKDVGLVLANCTNNFKCAIIRCVAGPLQKNQEVWVSLQGRINAKFLNEMSKDREVLLTTVAAARVSRLPYMGRPTDATLTTFQAATHITPQVEAPSSGSVPLWVVVLAAVAGALLLLLLILALYKCGFFKRNRPADQAERQPLNRNGYGHGDEHL